MISVSKYLACVEQNVARVHAYQEGHDGSDGLCDCIGLGIGALRLAGIEWKWTHGSNYAARYRTKNLRTVSSAKDLKLGESVFKGKLPGESGYNMPAKYKSSGDLHDYYHYGIVTRVNPLQITHCTGVSGGIKRDTSLGNWGFAGENSFVNYDEGGDEPVEEVLYRAVVHADNGYPVKMRSKPDCNSNILAKIPLGVTVNVLDELNGWAKIGVDGQTGYMMLKFLSKEGDVPDIDDGNSDGSTVTISRAHLTAIKAMLSPFIQDAEKLLDEVEAALNGGAVG